MASQPRGLQNFIADIRNAPNQEEERIRVDKELANIRLKFASSSNLNSYQKKKYVWKMCYIYMLGYDIDFGHLEIISLLSSTKFQEKSVGYMGVSLLLKPGDEMMTLVVNSMRNDLIGNIHHGATLALSAVANIGGNDLAEALCPDVQRLIIDPQQISKYVNPNTVPLTPEEERLQRSSVRKKAVLCLLRLFRTNPECVDVVEWAERFPTLLEDQDIGVVTSTMSLLLGFGSNSPENYSSLVPYVVQVLERLVVSKRMGQDYFYYQIPCPWLLVKCLRYLQYFRAPPEPESNAKLMEILRKILNKSSEGTDAAINKANAEHAVLFEACNVVISYGSDADDRLHDQVLNLLGRFLSGKDANTRYLGLDAMSRLARQDGPSKCQAHQEIVITSLKDADVSVGKRALDLLYVITDANNAVDVVGELLLNIAIADISIKDDYVVKIAILAEKFAPSLQWYLDTMVQTILVCGDHVSDDVWHRIVRMITNHPDLHEYAAEKMMEIVQSKFANETAIQLASYVLGEFGMHICEKVGMSGYDQFAALQQHFPGVSVPVRALMLTTYVKILNLYPDCQDVVMDVFRKHSNSGHLDLQQRACEYLHLPSMGPELMEKVLNTMPMYPENQENVLLNKLTKSEDGANVDKSAWKVDKGERSVHVPATSHQDVSIHSQKVAPLHQEVDLLSLDDSPVQISRDPVGISADLFPFMKKWFNACVLAQPKQPSVLFENEILKVTVISEYNAHQGRIAVNFDNKSDEISDFKVNVGQSDAIQVQKQDPASRISFSESARLNLAVVCMRPFSETLDLNISFTVGVATYVYPLKLPVTAISFCEPIVLDKPNYMQRWKALEGEDREVQEIFTSANKVSAALVAAFKSKVVPALHLGLATDIDNDLSVTACCSFRTGTVAPDGGGNITVGTMLRIEADEANNRFRITVRAKHGVVALAIKNVIKAQLS